MDSSRVRLEGRLEILERTVTALEEGEAAARALDFAALATAVSLDQSPQVQDARAKVEQMSAEDAALSRVLERLEAVRRKVEKRVKQRRKELHMIPLPLLPAVQGLCDDPVIYRARPGWRREFALALLVLLVIGLVLTRGSPAQMLPGMFVMVFASLARFIPGFAPVPVMVTKKRLVLKDVSIELSKVHSVDINERPMPARSPHRLLVMLVGGERIEQDLQVRDQELERVMLAVGLEVTWS